MIGVIETGWLLRMWMLCARTLKATRSARS
jgi:hypothetical protein